MTPHDRYIAFMHGRPVDRPPLQEWGPWEVTVRRWMRESGRSREQVRSYLRDCDPEFLAGVDFGMIPAFDDAVVEDDGHRVTRRDRLGALLRELKEDPETSMPEFVDFPVKTRRDWEAIKPRFDPSTAARYPADWDARVRGWRNDKPILRLYSLVTNRYGGPSLFGFARMLMGDERVLYAFYDDPMMVHDMMESATEFAIAVLLRALKDAPVTLVQFWEDMCYRQGPLISPALFREFMLPRYRRITDAIRRSGVDIIFVDSDGDVSELIPLWLEAGINGVFPMEQACGNDLHAYRRKFGRDLLMAGGIDKRALARGRKAIKEELRRQLPLVAAGGYVPTVDHAIPPDVSFADFCYYWDRKKIFLGLS